MYLEKKLSSFLLVNLPKIYVFAKKNIKYAKINPTHNPTIN